MFLGNLAGIASAATWALSSLILAGCLRRMPALAVSSMRVLFGSAFYLVMLVATGNVPTLLHLHAGTVLALAATALMAMGVGDTMYITGMHRIGVSRASPISVTVYPLLTVLLAWALLGEVVSFKTAIGGVLVIAGIVLVVLRPEPEPLLVLEALEPPEYGTPEARAEAAIAAGAVTPFRTPASVPAIAAAVRVPDIARARHASPLPADVAGRNLPEPPSQSATQSRSQAPPELGAGGRGRGRGRSHTQALSWMGLALVVAATVTWAFSSVWLRTLTTGVNVLVVNSVRVPATGIFLGSVAGSRGMLSLRRYRPKDLALVAVAGLVGSAVGSLLYVYALEEIGAGRSALLNSLSPVFALPLAALFLNERITRLMVAGTALALAGAWLFVV